jgi:hypothetical protein
LVSQHVSRHFADWQTIGPGYASDFIEKSGTLSRGKESEYAISSAASVVKDSNLFDQHYCKNSAGFNKLSP